LRSLKIRTIGPQFRNKIKSMENSNSEKGEFFVACGKEIILMNNRQIVKNKIYNRYKG
jgi:hypothetical protein